MRFFSCLPHLSPKTAALVDDWSEVAGRQSQASEAGALGGAAGAAGVRVQGQQCGCHLELELEGIKPSYGRGEGHPLPNCDCGRNVWGAVGGRLVCTTPGWGITDAGSRRPLSQRSSGPSSGGERDSVAVQSTPAPTPPNQ